MLALPLGAIDNNKILIEFPSNSAMNIVHGVTIKAKIRRIEYTYVIMYTTTTNL